MPFIKFKTDKSDMDIKLPIHRFTVEEYQRLAEDGILHEDDRVELLEGRIIDMTPVGSRHASCVARLASMFFEKIQKRAIWSVVLNLRSGVLAFINTEISLVSHQKKMVVCSGYGSRDG